jgi:hypothetical protein
MKMDKDEMTDRELDQLLKAVRQPGLPKGFADRLQAKLDAPASAQIIGFPKRTEAAKTRLWLSALPLAASLAIGLYWGAVGTLPESLSNLTNTVLASNDDATWSIGIEDTELFLNGELS